ncbi:hypothetical protein [Anaerostipes caccae]|uniref:hypothetical protein n=1 Tax=Anaerostipes caccae TaxID=105841 RepID=UPI0002D269A1|nr:hypothetical protein [Anaerostipes caccae]
MRISDDLEEMRLLPIHVEAAVFGSGNVPIANINENYRSLLAAPTGDDMESKTFTEKSSTEEPGVHLHFYSSGGVYPRKPAGGRRGYRLSRPSQPVDGDKDRGFGKRRKGTGFEKKKLGFLRAIFYRRSQTATNSTRPSDMMIPKSRTGFWAK